MSYKQDYYSVYIVVYRYCILYAYIVTVYFAFDKVFIKEF